MSRMAPPWRSARLGYTKLEESVDTVHTLPGVPSANTPWSNWLPAGVFSST